MTVRLAAVSDAKAISEFGAQVVPDHYTPLLGAEAARAQVETWWTAERISRAAANGYVVIAEEGSEIVGVGEWGLYEDEPVIWKLYVRPSHRGRGVGSQLLGAIIDELPAGTDYLQVEHFAANLRAGEFYEREGFEEIRTVEDPGNPSLKVTWRERSLG